MGKGAGQCPQASGRVKQGWVASQPTVQPGGGPFPFLGLYSPTDN